MTKPPDSDDAPHSLEERQATFARKLLSGAAGLPPGITVPSPARPATRFNVHRNNVFKGLTECIGERFPVVKQLIGEVFFRAVAAEFVELHPPRSPVLFEYGDAFPGFLDTFEPLARMPYLRDVARLEWARNMAYHAADAEPIAATALAALPPEQIGDAVLHLHPSVRVVSSPYPIVSIWEAKSHGTGLQSAGGWAEEIALVVRPRLQVLTAKLGPGGDTFVEEIRKGSSLSVSAACGGWASQEFALTKTLAALLGAGACIGFALGGRAAR